MLLEYHITFVLRYLVVIIKWEIEAKDSMFVLALYNITLEFFVNWQMFTSNTVADPGFPSRGTNSKGTRQPITVCGKIFAENCMKLKEIWHGASGPTNTIDMTGLSQILFNFILFTENENFYI